MAELTFSKAKRRNVSLRCALAGPSGSGKTYTALRLATGLAEHTGTKIAFIDTEDHSAELYADSFDFDTLSLRSKRIADYVEAMRAAARGKYGVVIIDSLSHGWQELVAEVDKIAKARYRGNTWSAWSEGTPQQNTLINAIQRYPGHVVATMRSKTEWAQEDTGRGSKRPVRVGLAPEQRKGIEYEFDLTIEINPDHIAQVTKSRIAQLQDRLIEKPGEDLGRELAAWLTGGVDPDPPAEDEKSCEMVEQSEPNPESKTKEASAGKDDSPAPQSISKPPPASPVDAVRGLISRIKSCGTVEAFEAITGEIDDMKLTDTSRSMVKSAWLSTHKRLTKQTRKTV